MQRPTINFVFFLAAFSFATSCRKTTNLPPVVDAGPSQTVQSPVGYITLSGTATDAYSKIKSYQWSEVSGPNVPVITSESSPTTAVTGLIGGYYIFQLWVADSLGETGVDTVSVTVLPSGNVAGLDTTLDLPILDQLIDFSNHGASIRTYPELMAYVWHVPSGQDSIWITARSYFKFNFSPIPAGKLLKSAILHLYSDPTPQDGDMVHANAGLTNDFYLQRVDGSPGGNWDDSTTDQVDWFHQPPYDPAWPILLPATTQPFLDLTLDVTVLANNMMLTGNNGFVMQLKTETYPAYRIFCSNTYPDTNRHPKLTVTY